MLKQGLEHQLAHFRLVAALLVGQKKRPLHDELVELLADPSPPVRQAARLSLILLYNKKVDYGPLPMSTMKQAVEAQDDWRDYVKKNRR